MAGMRTAAAVLVLGLTLAGWSGAAAKDGEVIPAATPEELAQLLAGGKWTIVEFGGEHCIPCKAMQPILQALAGELGDRVVIRNFWIQKYPAVARAHKIMVMPTQVVFNPEGEEVLRHMGVYKLDEFRVALADKGLR